MSEGGQSCAERRPNRLAAIDSGDGPVVLLVHGQPGQGWDWHLVVEGLAPTDRVLVPDRPGYGRTAGRALGMAANADTLVRLLDEKGVDSATVVGHSYGGGVALAMATRHHDRVAGVVLVSSVGTTSGLGPYDRVLALPVLGEGLAFTGWELSRRLVPLLRRRSTRLPQTVRAWVGAVPEASVAADGLLRPEDGPGGRPRKSDGPGGGPRRPDAVWRSFVVEQRALLAETPQLEARLSSIRVPTAVVAGERDRVVPARAAADLARAIPGAELIWVPGAGHLLPQEAPAVLVEIIRRYSSHR